MYNTVTTYVCVYKLVCFSTHSTHTLIINVFLSSLDLDKLLGILRQQCDIWRALASALDIPQERVALISSHCQSDYDSMVEVCDAWLRGERTALSWKKVMEALGKIGAHQLAAEIKEMLEIGKFIVY